MNPNWAIDYLQKMDARTCRGRLAIELLPVAETADQVTARVNEFGGQGWACMTDRVLRLTGEPLPHGTLLAAELFDGPRTLHVRYQDGVWRLRQLTFEEGDEHLIVRRELALLPPPGEPEAGGTMIYEVAWSRQGGEDPRWRPWAARLAGMEVRS